MNTEIEKFNILNFSEDNLIKLCYAYSMLKVKPISVLQVEKINYLIETKLFNYDVRFNILSLQKKEKRL